MSEPSPGENPNPNEFPTPASTAASVTTAPRTSRRITLIAAVAVALNFILLIILFISGFHLGGAVRAVPTPTTGPGNASTCKEVPGFENAKSAKIASVAFPDDGVALTSITTPTNTFLQVAEYDACVHDPAPAPNAALQRVKALTFLVDKGWQSARSFPFDGKTPQKCDANQACFTLYQSDYLLIEAAAENSHGVLLFRLLRAQPASLVACDPALFPSNLYSSTIQPYAEGVIPLPPGTSVGETYGTGQTLITNLCSPGTASEVNTYMQAQLPQEGWTTVEINEQTFWKIGDPLNPLYMRLPTVTDPRNWQVIEYEKGVIIN